MRVSLTQIIKHRALSPTLDMMAQSKHLIHGLEVLLDIVGNLLMVTMDSLKVAMTIIPLEMKVSPLGLDMENMPPMDIVVHHNMPDKLQDLMIPVMEARPQNLRLVLVISALKMRVQTKLHTRDLA